MQPTQVVFRKSDFGVIAKETWPTGETSLRIPMVTAALTARPWFAKEPKKTLAYIHGRYGLMNQKQFDRLFLTMLTSDELRQIARHRGLRFSEFTTADARKELRLRKCGKHLPLSTLGPRMGVRVDPTDFRTFYRDIAFDRRRNSNRARYIAIPSLKKLKQLLTAEMTHIADIHDMRIAERGREDPEEPAQYRLTLSEVKEIWCSLAKLRKGVRIAIKEGKAVIEEYWAHRLFQATERDDMPERLFRSEALRGLVKRYFFGKKHTEFYTTPEAPLLLS